MMEIIHTLMNQLETRKIVSNVCSGYLIGMIYSKHHKDYIITPIKYMQAIRILSNPIITKSCESQFRQLLLPYKINHQYFIQVWF
jgi:hypothetical protein